MTSPSSSFARLLTPDSLPRYLLWQLTGRRDTVAVRLRDGPKLLLRPRSAGNNDYGVAYEVFLHRHYDCPRPLPAQSIRRILDLGANVGFSCLWWLTRFPGAEVIALEPHPNHFAQCRVNLSTNGLLPRVELHQAAAGTETRHIMLSDAGSSSSVLAHGTAGIEAEMLDVFDLLGDQCIDLMKLDIEGGEYAILDDARFPALGVKYLVMEWHGGPERRDHSLQRFCSLGYEPLVMFDHGSQGMVWAFLHPSAGAD
ncbi:MAG TPA: FkbM family methyltransferase [Acetobacteraceae bacterium]|nr:FkbM family methyltransferase [Acetobacteraceae bacterium]